MNKLTSRDGLYDHSDMFLVYEYGDLIFLKQIITKIIEETDQR